MQNKGYIQSRTLKILLSVHAPNRGRKWVKNKSKGVTPCRGHPQGVGVDVASPTEGRECIAAASRPCASGESSF